MFNRSLNGNRLRFRPGRRASNVYRLLLWFSLILVGAWLALGVQRGQIEPLFQPTPTPTRTVDSYVLEGQSMFQAGKLDDAIAAYMEAVRVAPDARLLAELARIQTYSSSLLSTDSQRYTRLEEALKSIDRAVELTPDDAQVLAIRALVLDWYAANPLVDSQRRQSLLNDAEREATRAYNLDLNNALALAFYAEILVDQQKWGQAEKYIQQAAELDSGTMDVHRVYGYVWESLAQYRLAIEEYQKAAAINPNLTFLYIFIGRNFLSLKVHPQALENFERAASINAQLGVRDPIPYIEIAKTYTRDGEFFVAALNAEKALLFDPYNPNTYGQVGSIYTKTRNFEDARPAFKCAVRGCSAEENTVAIKVLEQCPMRGCTPEELAMAQTLLEQGVEVKGLPLTSITVAYYYVQYGSVLAALSRPQQNYCPEALQVLDEVRQAFPNDNVLISIVDENINICNLVGNASR
jgi:tetratricopeptide (TPR) repeat protein